MIDDASLRGLATLTVVSETGSFAGAARTLGVTRAAVSKRVADLEEHLGVRLLHRTTRKITLTEVGLSVVERAHRMRAEAEEAVALARGKSESPTGVLRVTAPLGLGQRFVAPALASFVAKHPKLGAELILSDNNLDLVEQSIDLAIRGGRLVSSSLKAQKLGPLSLIVCGAPRYLKLYGHPKAPRDLLQHAWIVLTPMGRPQKLGFTGPDGKTTVRLDGRLASNDGETVRRFVESGLGLALLPSFWVNNDLEEGRLQHVLPNHTVAGGALYAVHPYGNQTPIKVKAFVEALRMLRPSF